MSESKSIIGALQYRHPDGRSLIVVIRNGGWDALYFDEITERLRLIPFNSDEDLEPEALHWVINTLGVAFFASPKWSFPNRSAERDALNRLVTVLLDRADKWVSRGGAVVGRGIDG